MRLIQKIGIDPDDTIWKTQIKVDLGDFIPQRKCRDAICDISKFLSSPLFKLFVHNYHLQSDLVLSLPQLKRIIWDFWGQLQSGSDLYFITGILFSMIHLISYTILGTIWNVIEDMQGLCQGPLSLYNAVFPIILHHLMLSLLNIFLTFSILLNFLTVDMENLNINENTIGGRNYVDPDTISSDELLEPGFVEGEKGWGNFLKSGNTSIGGGVTINKWLRDGKSQNRVGRSGGTRAYAGTDGRSTMTGTEAVGINVGQPIQHALFGRVKVVRDERRRCLTFQTAIANPMTKVASYDEGVQWVPFTINSETLARPFVHSAIGQRILLERRNDITHLLQADPVNTVTSSALVVSNSTAVSAGHMAATVPKKRMRINSEGNNEEAEVEHTMGEGPDVMKVDEHNEGFNAAVRAIPMQTNPLFVNKIVMASSGFQNRQPK
ncbi:hypothetical protein QL285_087354 [Trifolium repens]|nr:hypothetical protein QL285_087354 [Trifolium repens]